MIRILEQRAFEGDKTYIEAVGLSTETSVPTAGIVTGSVFLEVDTGKVYLFDEVGAEWHEVGGSSSGTQESLGEIAPGSPIVPGNPGGGNIS